MDVKDMLRQIDELKELTPEAKAAAKQMIENPQMLSEDFTQFDGMCGQSLDTLHAFAYHFYKQGQYEQAASFFHVLTTLDLLSKDYWMGLAASLQMAGKFAEALGAYGVASNVDSDSPFPHFHAAECYFAMKKVEDAYRVLEISEDLCGPTDAHQTLLQQIAVLKESWSNQTTKPSQEPADA